MKDSLDEKMGKIQREVLEEALEEVSGDVGVLAEKLGATHEELLLALGITEG